MNKLFKKKNIKYYLIYYALVEWSMDFPCCRIIVDVIKEFLGLITHFTTLEVFLKSLFILFTFVVVWALLVVFITLPVTIFLLARKSADVTQEIQNRKYNSKENIVYYREKLEGISPTTISLMQNLKVEEEKDLAATLMKLQLNKNIKIENDEIQILSDDVSRLTTSEKQLFYIIADQKINKKQISGWAEVSVREAETAGYIKEQNPKKGLFTKKLILWGMLGLFILGFMKFYPQLDIIVAEVDKMQIPDDMLLYEFATHEGFDYYFKSMSVAIVLTVSMVGLLAWLPFYIVYTARYKNKNNSLKRTEKGDQLTDVILGMKRFIHDFSMLDTATKEQIALWDDFLIYAIVLEENEKIIDEILAVKNVQKVDTRKIVQ